MSTCTFDQIFNTRVVINPQFYEVKTFLDPAIKIM